MASKLHFPLFLACILASACHGFRLDPTIAGYSQEQLSSPGKILALFEDWMSKHSKNYSSLEDKMERFEVFKDNLNHIDRTNRHAKSYWLGLNQFADLSCEEFRNEYLGLNRNLSKGQNAKSNASMAFLYKDYLDIPTEVDWRELGAVTPVKNQGRCGSCWAFSAVAAIEGLNKIVTGELLSLSEQELIDCDTTFDYGCSGGLMDNGFAYVIGEGGIHSEEDYPYKMDRSYCNKPQVHSKQVTIDGYEVVPENSELSLLVAVARQPVSIAIEASGRHFQFYKRGVFDGQCGTDLDHALTAIGYGSSHGHSYIIAKNSWGLHWGESGYIRMAINTGLPEGICGMYMMASYPTKNRVFSSSMP